MKGGMDREAESGGSLQRCSHEETKINSRTKIGFFFAPWERETRIPPFQPYYKTTKKKKEMCRNKGALWKIVRLLASFRTLFRISWRMDPIHKFAHWSSSPYHECDKWLTPPRTRLGVCFPSAPSGRFVISYSFTVTVAHKTSVFT